MGTSFSASAPALGYLYQVRRALFDILSSKGWSEIIVEGLDDIQVGQGGQTLTLEQLKHHSGTPANLTDASSDLWKTLRVWSTELLQERFDPATTALALITTAVAAAGSVAALLRTEGRDVEMAERRLVGIAESSSNVALAPSFEAFLALPPASRSALLAAVRVIDNSPGISDLEAEIKDEIRYATRPQWLTPVYERLEGWWFGRVVRQLTESSNSGAIGRNEVHLRLVDIAEQFQEDSLPIDFLDAIPDVTDSNSDRRMFVRQLREVTQNERRIELAILDFYRAFSQRARWLREDLLVDADLNDYENRLFDAWERYKVILEDSEALDVNNQEQCTSFGLKLLTWMEQDADVQIRPKVTEGYVMRGSYHILADMPVPRLWWHPLFLDRLASVLS